MKKNNQLTLFDQISIFVSMKGKKLKVPINIDKLDVNDLLIFYLKAVKLIKYVNLRKRRLQWQ